MVRGSAKGGEDDPQEKCGGTQREKVGRATGRPEVRSCTAWGQGGIKKDGSAQTLKVPPARVHEGQGRLRKCQRGSTSGAV